MSSFTRMPTQHRGESLRPMAADSTGSMAPAVHPPRADMMALAEELNQSLRVAQLRAISTEANGRAVIQRMVRVNGAVRNAQSASLDEVRTEARRQTRNAGEIDVILATYRQWVTDRQPRRFDTLAAMVMAIRSSLAPVEQSQPQTLARQESVSSAPTGRRQTAEILVPQTTGTQSQTQATDRQTSHDQVVEQQEEQAENAGQIPPMPDENRTRVGFEVELGGYYIIPNINSAALGPVINRTLATCSVNNREILQMLIDDPRPEGRNATRVQIEFRTPPLDFEDITQELGTLVRDAIRTFPIRILQTRRTSQHRGTPQIPPQSSSQSRGQNGTHARAVAPTLTWAPSEALQNLLDQILLDRLGRARTPSRFTANSTRALAQHATTSIEIDAFSRISGEEQALLFGPGQGVTSAQGLVDRLAVRTSAAGGGEIDASTGGRNTEGTTVKTPIESLIAGDPTLVAPDERAIAEQRGGQVANTVTVGGGTHFPLGDIQTVAGQIRRRGAFPDMQGQSLDPDNPQEEQGFRAVAEKLQPPLRDTTSGRLRVLVEHRTGGLRDAVNAALGGNSRPLNAIKDAARTMDAARRRRRSGTAGPQTRPSSPGGGGPGGNGGQNQMDQADREVLGDNRGRTSSPSTDRARGGGGGMGAPAWEIPHSPLNLANLVVLAGPGIAWATNESGQGTYSPEFVDFRDHPDAAFASVIALGLAPEAAAQLRHQMTTAMLGADILGAGGEVINANYIEAQQQQAIFAQVGGGMGDQLWALLRYARAVGV